MLNLTQAIIMRLGLVKNQNVAKKTLNHSLSLAGQVFLVAISVIIANPKSNQLADVDANVYTRDLFGNDS